MGLGGNHFAALSWQLNGSLPAGTTWTIGYTSPAGNNPVVATGLPLETRSYKISGLKNYVKYNVTVSAVASGGNVLLSGGALTLPTDIFVFVPLAER
jgi:hypothetical protein